MSLQALGRRAPASVLQPYLAFPAMVMAGVDGIKNKMEPPQPVDKDLHDLPPDDAAPCANHGGPSRCPGHDYGGPSWWLRALSLCCAGW